MTDVVRGDAASCSQAGGALRQLAARLRVSRRPVRASLDALAADPLGRRPGRVLTQAGRRVEVVDRATHELIEQLDAVGSALQAHATELAEAVAQGRQVAARAEVSGLRVSAGVVEPGWGVTGVADSDASAALETGAAALQSELDGIVSVLGRRRQRLVGVLSESGAVLAASAGELRR